MDDSRPNIQAIFEPQGLSPPREGVGGRTMKCRLFVTQRVFLPLPLPTKCRERQPAGDSLRGCKLYMNPNR